MTSVRGKKIRTRKSKYSRKGETFDLDSTTELIKTIV